MRRGSQIVLLAAGFVILIAMAGTSVWLAWKSTSDSAWVTHSLDVENALTMLQLSVRRAESGQRGFLLTSNPDYLTVYSQSAERIEPRLTELADMVRDNPDQLARLEQVRTIALARRQELARLVELQQQGRQSEALEIIRGPEGIRMMADFTQITGVMRQTEAELLVDRQRRTATTSAWLIATTLLGVLAIIVLAGRSMLLIRRQTAQLVEAQATLAEANAHLEEKVSERTADLQEANDELQRFAYIVSHDLRSPLVNIMGFTGELDAIRRDLVEEAERSDSEAPDPKQEALLSDFDEAIGFIKSSIGKMDRLIHAILALSRAGRRDFKPEPLDLGATLSTIRDALTHQVQEADATIEIGPMPKIVSDRVAIEQIFSNLLDNAVKYLTAGRPGRIEVTAGERGGFALIRVTDNGRGIDLADRDRVFDLFRRAGAQDRPGEGIGLAHVRALIRRLGGSIRLDSEPGKGSTFTVILPKQWKQEEARAPSGAAREPSERPSPGARASN